MAKIKAAVGQVWRYESEYTWAIVTITSITNERVYAITNDASGHNISGKSEYWTDIDTNGFIVRNFLWTLLLHKRDIYSELKKMLTYGDNKTHDQK